MTEAARILVIEQDKVLQVRIVAALEGAGFKVTAASEALDGLKKLYETYPDLIIMAKDLPMVNGEDSCLRVRQAVYMPIIVLGSESEAAEMLELGADAYVVKPTSLAELVARVRSLLRRKPRYDSPGGAPGLGIDSYLTDDEDDSDGLSPTEYRLASCLIHNKGIMLGYPELISGAWENRKVSVDTLHYYMRSLRQKLANGTISMFRGVGYCFSGEG